MHINISYLSNPFFLSITITVEHITNLYMKLMFYNLNTRYHTYILVMLHYSKSKANVMTTQNWHKNAMWTDSLL